MTLPDEVILLVAGVPATGKSTFGRYLRDEHGFAHYDLERYPCGWAHPELMPLWSGLELDAFLDALSARDSRVVLDWGFPPRCLSMAEKLCKLGAVLVWFDGDRRRAREVYIERGGQPVALFDGQVAAIESADLPSSLGCRVVNTLGTTGLPADPRVAFKAVFP